jgi:hypothetical protein
VFSHNVSAESHKSAVCRHTKYADGIWDRESQNSIVDVRGLSMVQQVGRSIHVGRDNEILTVAMMSVIERRLETQESGAAVFRLVPRRKL